MSYAVFNVVYGAFVQDDKNKKLFWDLIDDSGIVQPYNGNGESPIYVGVRLFGFDECDVYAVDELILQPTDEQKKEAEDMIAALSEELRAALSPIKTWLIPSSS